MGPDASKIRFEITPGRAARNAEQEREAGEAVELPRIKAGTAARMAEAEAREASAPAYRFSLQARTGRPFSAASERTIDDPAAQPDRPWEKPRDRKPENHIAAASRHLGDRTADSVQAAERDAASGKNRNSSVPTNLPSTQNAKETPADERPRFHTIRSLFLRKLLGTAKETRE